MDKGATSEEEDEGEEDENENDDNRRGMGSFIPTI